MELNGLKLPITVALSIITFTFWLGGLSYKVYATEDDVRTHKAEPAHAEQRVTMATVESNVKHNKETLDKLVKQREEDRLIAEQRQRELLEAINRQLAER